MSFFRAVQCLKDCVSTREPKFEPVVTLLAAQMALESGFGESQLAKTHKNFAGLKWRTSLQGFCKAKPHGDWSGKEDYYCAVDSEEEFAPLFLFFIQRSPYAKANAALPDPIEFFQQLAIPFVAEAPGVKREQFETNQDYEKAVDIAYTLRVFRIAMGREFLQKHGLPRIHGLGAAIDCLEVERDSLGKDTDDDYPVWLMGPRPA